MGAKIWEMVAKFLLIPLIKDGIAAFWKWWNKRQDEKKRSAQNTQAAENHANAQTAEQAAQTMEEMP